MYATICVELCDPMDCRPPGSFVHGLLQARILVLCLVAWLCLTLYDPMDYSQPDSSVLGDSPGKNAGVGCHALLQGIFPTQGLNQRLLGLLHCRWILYC